MVVDPRKITVLVVGGWYSTSPCLSGLHRRINTSRSGRPLTLVMMVHLVASPETNVAETAITIPDMPLLTTYF